MRIAYVTPSFPYGREDPFLTAEIAAIAELGAEIVIVPAATPRTPANAQDAGGAHVMTLRGTDPRTLTFAFVQACAAPSRAASICRSVLFGSYGWREKRQNAAVLTKSFAAARALASYGVDHVHAHRSTVPSTIAYIVSALTGIPWSCTAQWIDAAQNNMLASKAASAAFIRATSARAKASVVGLSGSGIDGRCAIVPPALRLPERSRPPADFSPLRIAWPSNFELDRMLPVMDALSALRERVPFECDIIGEGPSRAAAAAWIAREGLGSRVRLRPSESQERFYARLCNGEYAIAVFSDAVPEYYAAALVAGMPCITCGPPEDLLEDGCVLNVQPEPARIADAIAALHRDRERCSSLARRALESARARFDPRANGRRLLQLMGGAS
jgi:glycosyltransferase involved in cell wall biosynthesis